MIDRSPTGRDDAGTEIHGPVNGGAGFRWLVGVAGALTIAAYAVSILVTQHATFGGRHGTMKLAGLNAVAIGVAWLGVAIFVHCRYFWDELHDSHWLSELGKIVALLLGVGGLVTLLVRNGLLGIQ